MPTLADFCTMLLLTDQGSLRAASVVHRDPAKAATLEELRAIDIPPDSPLLQVTLTQATTQLVTDISGMVPGGTRAAREITDILQRVGPRAWSYMPFFVGQRVAGAVVLGRDDGRPRFTETDVAVIEELARRMAAGVGECRGVRPRAHRR